MGSLSNQVGPSPKNDSPNGGEEWILESQDEKTAATTTVPASSSPSDKISPKGVFETIANFEDSETANENSNSDSDNSGNEGKDASGPAPWRHFILVFSLFLTQFLPALDQTIVSTALPDMMRSLAASESKGGHVSSTSSSDANTGYTWVGTSFALAQAIVLPLFGQASEVWGRKAVFLAAVLFFTLGSALCGAAQTVRWLIAARAVQGIGGGGITSLVYILIGDLVGTRKRGTYQGFLGATWGVASALGPVLGGVLSEKATWRWCFFINLPVCACCLVIIFLFLNLKHPGGGKSFLSAARALDGPGIFMVAASTALLLVAFELASQGVSWASARVLVCLIVSIVGFGLFFWRETKAPRPIMALHFFRHRTRFGAYVAAPLHAMGYAGISYYTPLYFQGVRGTSASSSGVRLLPLVLSVSATSIASGFIITHTRRYRIMINSAFALGTLGVGLLMLLDANTSTATTCGLLFFAGLGVGANFNSMLIAIHASFDEKTSDPSDIALSSSTYAFLRSLGVSLGISVGGLVCFEQLSHMHLSSASSSGDTQQHHPSITAIIETIRTLHGPERDAAVHIFWLAMHHVFLACTVIMAAGTLMSLLIKEYPLGDEVRTNQGVKKPIKPASNEDSV